MNKVLKNNDGFLERESTQKLLFWLILAAGIFARVYRFGLVPNGLNQDEARAGYEAWSLLNYGIDTAGYHNPVYLTAWGSGMNALETYLMIPFIALFGLKVWVIRMPQLIVACLSLPTAYSLVKRTVDRRAGLMAMFMLAICPWHIILSRWGLESNLAPGFLLFGLYFFIRAAENEQYLLLSALMYGLSLYTYATIWPFVPVIILLQLIYCMAYKKLRFSRYLLLFVLILFVMALPLLLFLLVNYGYIDEIRTSFFSIPKLLYMRSDELSFRQKRMKLETALDIFINQSDNNIWNSPEKFGLFYFISMPFAVFGFIFCVCEFIAGLRRREYRPAALLLVQFVAALPICVILEANATKINILFMPVVLFAALGVYFLSSLTHRHVLTALACIYAVLFIGFEVYYFTDYDEAAHSHYSYGLEQALDIADEKANKVYLDIKPLHYSKVLFYTQTPVDVFRDTVHYVIYPSPYLDAVSFDHYYFQLNSYQPEDDAAYIMPIGSDTGLLEEEDFTFEYCGCYMVAYKENGE